MCIFVFGSGQKCVLSFDSLLRFHEPESNVNVDDHHKVKEYRSVVSSTYINAYVSFRILKKKKSARKVS